MKLNDFIASEIVKLLELPLSKADKLEILTLAKEMIKRKYEKQGSAKKVLSLAEWRTSAKMVTIREAMNPLHVICHYAMHCDPREVSGFFLYKGDWLIERLHNGGYRLRHAGIEEVSNNLADLETMLYEFYKEDAAERSEAAPRINIVGIGVPAELLAELEAVFNPKPNR